LPNTKRIGKGNKQQQKPTIYREARRRSNKASNKPAGADDFMIEDPI
jgi:hypothetical protein